MDQLQFHAYAKNNCEMEKWGLSYLMFLQVFNAVNGHQFKKRHHSDSSCNKKCVCWGHLCRILYIQIFVCRGKLYRVSKFPISQNFTFLLKFLHDVGMHPHRRCIRKKFIDFCFLFFVFVSVTCYFYLLLVPQRFKYFIEQSIKIRQMTH